MSPGTRTSALRICAILGVGLVAISIVMANLPPFLGQDMRRFTWVGAAAIILITGGLLLVIAAVGWITAVIRRRV